jgi:hypothetical protein
MLSRADRQTRYLAKAAECQDMLAEPDNTFDDSTRAIIEQIASYWTLLAKTCPEPGPSGS